KIHGAEHDTTRVGPIREQRKATTIDDLDAAPDEAVAHHAEVEDPRVEPESCLREERAQAFAIVRHEIERARTGAIASEVLRDGCDHILTLRPMPSEQGDACNDQNGRCQRGDPSRAPAQPRGESSGSIGDTVFLIEHGTDPCGELLRYVRLAGDGERLLRPAQALVRGTTRGAGCQMGFELTTGSRVEPAIDRVLHLDVVVSAHLGPSDLVARAG